MGPYQLGQFERSSGRVLVRTHEHEGAFRPVPSPDGKWVVYSTRFDDQAALKLLDLESESVQWLVMGVDFDQSRGGGTRDRDLVPGSSFTPDSKALITSYGGKIMRVEVPSGDASVISFTADVHQELGPLVKFDYAINDSVLSVSQIRGARPSPDGTQIAFSYQGDIWTSSVDGTNLNRLTIHEAYESNPIWNNDGSKILFSSDRFGNNDVFSVSATGGTPTRIRFMGVID